MTKYILLIILLLTCTSIQAKGLETASVGVPTYTEEAGFVTTNLVDIDVNRFYIPMLVISFIAVLLLLLSYATLSLNHFNFQSLVFILIGAIVASMGDLLGGYEPCVFYVKILGMLILSYGVYKVIQKYIRYSWIVYLYVFTILIGFSLAYFTYTISIVYYTIALLSSYLLIYNIKRGIHRNRLINLATVLYVSFSVIIGLARDTIIPYSNTYSLLFGLGYLLQIFSSKKRSS